MPTEFLQLDEPGDGSLWVHGGTYKARFDARGAQYLPYFGPGTPRHYPVTFGPPSATLGGETLAVDREAAPRFEGEAAVFERGALRERYDVRSGQIEQLFVFDALPGTGELVVRMDVATPLAPEDQGQRLAFVGEHGSVHYGLATALDADGNTVAAPTRLVEGGIEIRVPASFVASAALPLVIDPVISTFDISLNSNEHDILPDVAYDSTNARFHVTYEREYTLTDHDIWSELRSASGALVTGSGFYLDFTTNDWRYAKTANNRIGTNFVTVAQVRPSAGGEIKIWSRMREAESNGTGSQIQVSYGAGNMYNPDIGGDPHTVGPTYYCVVWERAVTLGVDHDIQGQLITSNGLVLLGGFIDVDSTSGSYDKLPNVSNSDGVPPAGTQEWNIVWQRQYSTTDWDIRGAQVHWSGVITAPSFSLDFSALDDRFPSASSPLLPPASGPRTWMAAYRRRGSDGVYDIQSRVYKGSSYYASANLSDVMGTSAGQDQFEPSVDSNGHQFVVAWNELYSTSSSDTDVYIASFYLAGTSVHASEGHVNLAFSSDPEMQVEVYARHSSGLTSDWVFAAWRDGGAGAGDIEGALYDVPDYYGPNIGTNYCTAVPNSTGFTGLIQASGSGHAGGNPFHLLASRMPLNQFGYFIASTAQANFSPGTSVGVVCVGNPLSRFNQQVQTTGGSGTFQLNVNTNSIPIPTGGTTAILAGQTWNFQGWYRDGLTNNLTNAVSVLFH
jgi:hypothetical protein